MKIPTLARSYQSGRGRESRLRQSGAYLVASTVALVKRNHQSFIESASMFGVYCTSTIRSRAKDKVEYNDGTARTETCLMCRNCCC